MASSKLVLEFPIISITFNISIISNLNYYYKAKVLRIGLLRNELGQAKDYCPTDWHHSETVIVTVLLDWYQLNDHKNHAALIIGNVVPFRHMTIHTNNRYWTRS